MRCNECFKHVDAENAINYRILHSLRRHYLNYSIRKEFPSNYLPTTTLVYILLHWFSYVLFFSALAFAVVHFKWNFCLSTRWNNFDEFMRFVIFAFYCYCSQQIIVATRIISEKKTVQTIAMQIVYNLTICLHLMVSFVQTMSLSSIYLFFFWE